VLLTEQNAVFALGHADRGYLIEKGRCRATGTSAELSAGTALTTYLGVAASGYARPESAPPS
jgi:ABC-type branched-subunit amino acid transport system ATPase component